MPGLEVASDPAGCPGRDRRDARPERQAREAEKRSGPLASVNDQADDRQGVAEELRRVAAELAELASGD